MAVIETWLRQDLKGLVTVRSLQGQVFSLDNGGNLIGVKVTKDGQPVTLTGTVTGYCILSDGQTVTVTGSGKSGIQNVNEAYIVLPQLVYSVPGQISIVIKLTSGSVTTTLAACTGYVYRSRTSNEVVPPGTPIPDLATMEEVIRRATEATTRATEAATDAEKVDAAMTKEGDVITISVTDRDGNVTEKTVTDQSEAMKHKADIDGYYEELAAGTADQLVSTEAVTDTTPYLYRKSGGSVDIGNRETLEKIVGGTVNWNQLLYDGNFPTGTTAWYKGNGTLTISNGEAILTLAGDAWNNDIRQSNKTVNFILGHKLAIMFAYKMSSGLSGNTLRVFKSQANTGKDAIYSSTYMQFRQIYNVENATAGNSEIRVSLFQNGAELSGESFTIKNFMILDLTAMFGPTIADYIYNLEQANEGAGVAWFRKLFPKNYYPYNPGELISVKPASHDMVGFNLWDEEWEQGRYNAQGEPTTENGIRSKNFIRIPDGVTQLYVNIESMTTPDFRYFTFDSNKNPLTLYGWVTPNALMPFPKEAKYIKFFTAGAYGNSYKHDICINLSHSGSRNGEYEPYEKHSYPLADVELRGPLAIDADGKLVYSGDEYPPDGLVKRKYGIADLGSLNWESYTSSGNVYLFKAVLNNFPDKFPGTSVINAIASSSKVVICSQQDWPNGFYQLSGFNGATTNLLFTYSDNDVSHVKAYLSGVYLLYELATPETEEVAPYTPVQVVDDWGTEEFVDTREVAIPVGHSTSYMANLRDKLQHLPSLADEDGEYIVKQTGSQMSLAPFKAGTYPDMHVGVADQLLSKQSVEDQVPYGLRQSGDGLAIGDREEDMIVGGTVAWNQLAESTKKQGTITPNDSQTYSTAFCNVQTALNHVYFLSAKVTYNGSKLPMRVYAQVGNRDYGRPTQDITSVGASAHEWLAKKESESQFSATIGISNVATSDKLTSDDVWAYDDLIVIDLTAMFGPTIADYIYSLEVATPGAGVAWFKKLFPKDYYEYNAGELKSVEAVNAHEMVGFNIWDEEWEVGTFDNNTGAPIASNENIRSKNFIPVMPNKEYLAYVDGRYPWITELFYDSDLHYISVYSTNTATSGGHWGLFTIPANASYMKFRTETAVYGNVYKNDICISLFSSSRNGEYEPYHKSSYPLDSSLTLRGIPKLDANNKLYYDGDTYAGDGTVTRKYGIVDLGTLTWSYNSTNGIFYSGDISHFVKTIRLSETANIICPKYETVAGTGYNGGKDKSISIGYMYRANDINIKDSAYTDAAAFKTAMSGVMLVYELKELTTEQAEPYQSVQQVDSYGTEEYTHSGDADVYIPVGHVTKYPTDLRSKIENAPDSPSGNGDYIVRKTAEGVFYVPLTQAKEIPAPPSANGTYRLTVTVANGTPTYSWVSA